MRHIQSPNYRPDPFAGPERTLSSRKSGTKTRRRAAVAVSRSASENMHRATANCWFDVSVADAATRRLSVAEILAVRRAVKGARQLE